MASDIVFDIIKNNKHIDNIWLDKTINFTRNGTDWTAHSYYPVEQKPSYLELEWIDDKLLNQFINYEYDTTEIKLSLYLMNKVNGLHHTVKKLIDLSLSFMYKFCSYFVHDRTLTIDISVFFEKLFGKHTDSESYFFKMHVTDNNLFEKVSSCWKLNIKRIEDNSIDIYTITQVMTRYEKYHMCNICFVLPLYTFENIKKVYIELFEHNVSDIEFIEIQYCGYELIKIDKKNMMFKCEHINEKMVGFIINDKPIDSYDMTLKIYFVTYSEKYYNDTIVGIHCF